MSINNIFNELVDFLSPFMGNVGSRRAIMAQALIGNPVLQQIDYTGGARDFVTNMLTTLQTHDEAAIIEVLKVLRGQVGTDKQQQIDQFIAELERGEEKGPVTARPRPFEPVNEGGRRWAVLVGVNEYLQHSDYQLEVCVNDAEALREQLITGGFEEKRIRLLTDNTTTLLPTRDEILTQLTIIAKATNPDDLLLFYFSGHGDENDGESYLIARNTNLSSLQFTGVKVADVKQIIEEAPARAKVMILDACHSGADISGKGAKAMTPEFIRRVFREAEGMAILASCEQSQLSYEWPTAKRSVFTHYLLEALQGQADHDNKGFVTVQDANRYVVNGVKDWAADNNKIQTPTQQNSMIGDIILADVIIPR